MFALCNSDNHALQSWILRIHNASKPEADGLKMDSLSEATTWGRRTQTGQLKDEGEAQVISFSAHRACIEWLIELAYPSCQLEPVWPFLSNLIKVFPEGCFFYYLMNHLMLNELERWKNVRTCGIFNLFLIWPFREKVQLKPKPSRKTLRNNTANWIHWCHFGTSILGEDVK